MAFHCPTCLLLPCYRLWTWAGPKAGIPLRRDDRGNHHRLSKVPRLFVISRQSTFSYKGKPVKVKQVSEELGVRYVLEVVFRGPPTASGLLPSWSMPSRLSPLGRAIRAWSERPICPAGWNYHKDLGGRRSEVDRGGQFGGPENITKGSKVLIAIWS